LDDAYVAVALKELPTLQKIEKENAVVE